MIRVVLILALCACTKRQPAADTKCEKARDRYLVDAERKGRDAIASVPPERRAKYEAELANELAQIRARFVEACTKHGFDVTCVDDPPADQEARRTKGKQCKEMFAPMAKAIFIERPSSEASVVPPASAECRDAQAKFLALSAARGERALTNIPEEHHADARAEMAKDADRIRRRFIPACENHKLEAACIDENLTPEREAECKPAFEAVQAEVFGN